MNNVTDISINNSLDHAVKSGRWGNPGAKLYDRLMASSKMWKDLIDEAYLVVGDITNNGSDNITPYSRSGCKYPHHIIRDNELVISIPGLKAAYARAIQQGIYRGKVKDHLEKHFKELGIEDQFPKSMKEAANMIIEENFNSIYEHIEESMGIDLFDEDVESIETGESSVTEAFEWIDQFINDDEFREAAVMETKIFQQGDFEDYTVDEIPDDAYLNGDDTDENFVEAEVEESPSADKEIPEEKPQSRPKQADAAEADKNGVRRKKLYIAFIEWCKEYNQKNTFGSIFDKDAFKISYPFVPHEMRYFYRLANPMLCVLAGDLTFFPVAELRKINSKNSRLADMMIFAATPTDMRVFKNLDKKVYRGIEENGAIVLKEVIADTFDTYIQNMIKKGDILNAPLEDDDAGKEDEV